MKVSVLIVSHNRKELLQQAIDSIFAQTFTDYEIILVDDGSDEDISGFRVDKYVKIPKSGIARARNIALMLAEGEYIFTMDSDDCVKPTTLEKLVNMADLGRYDLVFPQYEILNESGDSYNFVCKVQNFRELYEEKRMPHCGSLWRKSSVEGLWYDEQFTSAVDLDYTLNFMLKPRTIALYPEKLVLYRRWKQQETGNQGQIDMGLKVRHKYAQYLISTT